ncbi:hypothetical protein V3330_11365 [Wenzhouxiangellaceae bacterium CH-27]|uniref:Uncharacterized protein n=1 Tax=Elongatibacter sediminis TaxID=3119006 RepID=A0AAW9R9K1_9GAMM
MFANSSAPKQEKGDIPSGPQNRIQKTGDRAVSENGCVDSIEKGRSTCKQSQSRHAIGAMIQVAFKFENHAFIQIESRTKDFIYKWATESCIDQNDFSHRFP